MRPIVHLFSVIDEAFGGCERDSNLHQLLLLRANDDPTILDFMKLTNTPTITFKTSS